MKRFTIVSVIVLIVPSFFVARHFTERNRQAGNVRHDAQWFTDSIRVGNLRAVANYLSRPKVTTQEMEVAMGKHLESVMSTDFETAPISFRSDGSTLLATFECEDRTLLTFYTEDGGDIWRIAEIRSH